jgi:hypothetical protein
MTEPYPYHLPMFRRSHRAASPDGKIIAAVDPAYEVSMGNPTKGTLTLSSGFQLDDCNPSFIWSSDSRYLAVPHCFAKWGLFRRQRMAIVDVAEGRAFVSPEVAHYFQPQSFENGVLIAFREPTRTNAETRWAVPSALSGFHELVRK